MFLAGLEIDLQRLTGRLLGLAAVGFVVSLALGLVAGEASHLAELGALDALLASPSAFARVPLFLVALLVVRGVPALAYAKSAGPRKAVAAGLLQATSPPFIVTAAEIGVVLHQLTPVNGAALVGAALLSVVIFPPVALSLLGKE